jgi:hypothetical protein
LLCRVRSVMKIIFSPKKCVIHSCLVQVLCGVSKKFGEWYQKTNKTEDTNKLPLLAFKVITILHNTLLATFIKLLEHCQQCVVKDGDYFEG